MCGAALGISLLGCPPVESPKKSRRLSKKSTISFERAVTDPLLRQAYLARVARDCPPPVPVPVLYQPHEGHYANTTFPELAMIMRTQFNAGPGRQPQDIVIQVFGDAFKAMTEDDFKSTLFDHEYNHVEQLSGLQEITITKAAYEERDRIFNAEGDLFEAYAELRAYEVQMGKFPSRPGMSQRYRDEVRNTHSMYRNLVVEKERTPLVEWMLQEFPVR